MNPMVKMTLTAIITALVIGGGTYWYVNSKATIDKAALQTTIDGLNANVTALKKKVADLTPATTNTTPTTTPADTTYPTADWKTYTDGTYMFSLKYPPTWSVQKSSSSIYGSGKPIIAAYNITADTNAITEPGVFVYDPTKYVTNWDGTLSQFVKNGNPSGVTITSVTINEQGGLIRTQDTEETTPRNFVEVFLLKNGKVYSIVAKYSKTDTTSATIFKELYSSFKFTN